MKKKLVLFGLFFLLLLTVFYFMLFQGNDYYKVKLPVLSHVQDFRFISQNGKAVSRNDMVGKVYVTEYFFTTCKGICPKMNENMKQVFEKFKDHGDFAIISHTSMPETDSVPLMKKYEAKLIGGNPAYPAKWYFLTGQKDSLYRMARESYLLDNDKNPTANIADRFIHTQFFALVDKDQQVRGIYDGLKTEELKQLEDDIEKLLEETSSGRTVQHSGF